MTYNTRERRTPLKSSSSSVIRSNSSERTKKSMIRRRATSMDNCVLYDEQDKSGDEYFVPLVDESRAATYDYSTDDHSQNSYLSSGDERLSPSPPLHRNALPANPQSPESPRQHLYNSTQPPYASSRRAQRRYSNDSSYANTSRPGSPQDPNHVLPLRSSLVFTAHKRKSTFSFAVTAFCLLGFVLYGQSRSSLRITVREVDELVVFSETIHRKLREADHEMRVLERDLTQLDAEEARRAEEELELDIMEKASRPFNPELHEMMTKQRESLKKVQTMADSLKSQVIAISKQDAVDKYGSGVIRIKMDLIFPKKYADDGTVLEDTGPKSIIMEMASLDLMPHSVYTFLEMVSEGLLNGCSFIINAEHVLKAAPLPYDHSSSSHKSKQFSDAGLESVAFREYSPAYPHRQYTVGFAGDGSPSFYINSEDNSEIHVGDPCFARVVSGFDAVQRLDDQPTRNEIWFENRVGIQKVSIL